MGFYLRKSISVGPVRFNLSGSGIGVSGGVKGFRVGAGPRGNYVHVGRHGLYYRATLPRRSGPLPIGTPSPSLPQLSLPRPDGLTEIESGSVDAMFDSSSAELLEEIRAKRRLVRYWPFVLFLGLISLIAVAPIAPPWLSGGTLLGLVGLCVWLARRDDVRKTVVLMYELDGASEAAYQAFHDGFDWLARSQRAWHHEAKGSVSDRKKNAGATSLVRRSLIRPASAEPPGVRTNLAVPRLPVGRQHLYFFPDRILVFQGSSVGAVGYDQLAVSATRARFIEEESVPSDATEVGATWRYVNKNGGPDRRFKDNRELPILMYGELHLTSPTGLNEVLQVSNAEAAAQFAAGIESLRDAVHPSRPADRAITDHQAQLRTMRRAEGGEQNEVFAPGWETRSKVDVPPSFAIEAVGESFHIDTLRALCGPSTGETEEKAFRAFLIPETENPHDPTATLVWADGLGPVGHISRSDARRIASLRRRLLANNQIAVVSAKAVGGWGTDSAGRPIPPGILLLVDDGSTPPGEPEAAPRTAPPLPAEWTTRSRVGLSGSKLHEISAVGEGQYQDGLRQLLRQNSEVPPKFMVLLVPISSETEAPSLTAAICHETAGMLGRLSVASARKYARFLTALDRRREVGSCEAICIAEGKGFGLKVRLPDPDQAEAAVDGGVNN